MGITDVMTTIGAAVLAFGISNPANAVIIPFSDVVDPAGVGVTLTVGASPSFSYTHDISDSINIATDTIEGGNLAIVLLDIGGSESTTVRFALGAPQVLSGNVSNAGQTFSFDLDAFNLIAVLQSSGLLDLTITVAQHGSGHPSDVVFSSSTLTGFIERALPGSSERGDAGLAELAVAVPEPTSLCLLSAGLAGFGYAIRRRRMVASLRNSVYRPDVSVGM